MTTTAESPKRALSIAVVQGGPASEAEVSRASAASGSNDPGAESTESDLIAFCRERLAGFKVPKTVVFGPLPKTATGKVQKYVLRSRARGGL